MSLLKSSFNSSMVRLIEVSGLQNASDIALFQFQYGAIDRQYLFCHTLLLLLFQFQYGAIDSGKSN